MDNVGQEGTMMTDKSYYHMKNHTDGYAGEYALTDNEADELRAKGWDVYTSDAAPDTVIINTDPGPQHYHLVDSRGVCQGSRLLGTAEAGAMRELGWHLIHVGDGSKDMDEVRAVQRIIEQ